MNEQFVDFVTAKLLKELGFDSECRDYYNENGELSQCVHYKDGLYISFKNSDELYTTAPLWQQVEHWLWHNKSICILIISDSYGKIFQYLIYWKNIKIEISRKDLDSPIIAKNEGILKSIEYIHSQKKINYEHARL